MDTLNTHYTKFKTETSQTIGHAISINTPTCTHTYPSTHFSIDNNCTKTKKISILSTVALKNFHITAALCTKVHKQGKNVYVDLNIDLWCDKKTYREQPRRIRLGVNGSGGHSNSAHFNIGMKRHVLKFTEDRFAQKLQSIFNPFHLTVTNVPQVTGKEIIPPTIFPSFVLTF